MRRTLVLIIIFVNILLVAGVVSLFIRIGEKGRAIKRLEEQVAFLTDRLSSLSTTGNTPIGEGREDIIPSLIEDLKGNNFITQYQAGVKLKKIGPPAVPYLLETLKESGKSDMRPVLFLLKDIGDASLTPELIQIYKATSDTVNRAGILTILGRWAQGEAKGLIESAAGEQDWRIRVAAAQALGNYEGEGALTHLINLLGDKNRYVRVVAQRALTEIKDKRGLFEKVLRGGEVRNRYLLVNNLAALAGQDAAALLRIAARDENKAVSQAALKALSEKK